MQVNIMILFDVKGKKQKAFHIVKVLQIWKEMGGWMDGWMAGQKEISGWVDGYRRAWMDGRFGSPGVLPGDGAEVAGTTGYPVGLPPPAA